MKNDLSLVLNKIYIPIHLIGYKRTMSLFYQDHARALDENDIPHNWNSWLNYSMLPSTLDNGYEFVNTISRKIAIPNIIVLTHYDRLPKRDIKFSRENLFQRDKFRCAYCNKKYNKSELTVDHIIPKYHGGKTSWNNTITACSKCNSIKGNKTPSQAGMTLKFKPTEPLWHGIFKNTSNPNIRSNWKKYLKFVGI